MKTRFFSGFWAILYKEFIVMFRDRTTLFFMFFPPLIQIVAFGYALNFDIRHVPTAIEDRDQTLESRQLVSAFARSTTPRRTRPSTPNTTTS